MSGEKYQYLKEYAIKGIVDEKLLKILTISLFKNENSNHFL
jgi:hypothetical protein